MSTTSHFARRTACAAAAIACCTSAFAHITAHPDQAVAGNYFQTSLTVPHGCDGSPTLAIEVKIPEGVLSAKPQMKPGWTIELQTRPVDPPVKGEGGAMITRAVSGVTWRGGPLPHSEYDTFGLVMKLPATPGKTLYFPVVQTCANGSRAWTQIPAEGQAWHAVPNPAPFVRLAPAPADGASGMSDMPGMAGMSAHGAQGHADRADHADAHASH